MVHQAMNPFLAIFVDYAYDIDTLRIAAIDPDAFFLSHRSFGTYRAKPQGVALALKFQAVAGLKPEAVPHGLWNDDAPGVVDSQFHDTIMSCHLAVGNTIFHW